MPVQPLIANRYLDLLLDVVCVVDEHSHFEFVSSACERVWGYRQEELLGRCALDLIHPDDRDATRAVGSGLMAGDELHDFENRYLRKDGQVVHMLWSARWSAEDGVRVAVGRDISGRKRDEALRAALYSISEAAHQSDDLQALFARVHAVVQGLLPARNFFVGLYDEDSGTLSYPYHSDERQAAPQPAPLASCARSSRVILHGEPVLLATETPSPASAQGCADGGPQYWLGVPLIIHERTIGLLGVQSYGQVRYGDAERDLLLYVSTQVAAAIERRRMLERLEYLALYDSLTGLPNRTLLQDRVKGALARAQREDSAFALLYLDLDDFKDVNDSLGHAAGDCLLQAVAARLRNALRSTDTVARYGGDEFVVLLEGLEETAQTEAVCAKLRRVFGSGFRVEGLERVIGFSIGVAHYPRHGEDLRTLLRHADQDMYLQKSRDTGARPAAPQSA